jgi:DNA-binding ferritin-like protein (Dps family)
VSEILKKLIGDKKRWKKMVARAKLLPEDYQYVYQRIQKHMWQFAAGSGMDMIAVLEGLLELFEEGAANGRHVLEVTGEDVAAFCDELLRNARTYTEDWRQALNRDIRKKLGGEGGSR